MTDSPTAPSRTRIFLGDPPLNFAHAVRVGAHVFVAGMVALREGRLVGKGDAAVQTRQVLDNIEEALAMAGARFDEIVRYRVYLIDMADLDVVRSELNPRFGPIKPAGTLVAVSRLVHPDLKVEIDADAIIGSALKSTEIE